MATKSLLAGACAAVLFSVAIILPVQVWRVFSLSLLNWGPFLPVYTGIVSIGLGLLLGIHVTSQLVRRDFLIGLLSPMMIGAGLGFAAYSVLGVI